MRLRTLAAVGVLVGAAAGAVWVIGPLQRNDRSAISSALQLQLAGSGHGGLSNAAWKDVRSFYSTREWAPFWVNEKNLGRADQAVQLLHRAPEHGLVTEDYDATRLAQVTHDLRASGDDNTARASQLAQLDVRLTAAVLSLAHDIAIGRTRPERIDPRWKARRSVPDFGATLASTSPHRLKEWIDNLRPRHSQYARLQAALAGLRGGKHQEEASTAPHSAKRVKSDRGVKPTIESQMQQLAVNLERWRWMPDDLGARFIFVNIPAFKMFVSESGKSVLDMRVIAGKADAVHQTPIFSSQMTSVVFSPYWNIPDTIAEDETAPAIARDPTYLSKHKIEILQVSKPGTVPVSPASINWDDPDALKQYVFRQRPGGDNALGHIKFLLPNPFDVYLHDTPSDELFAKPGRALSHGCIRLERPEALAKYVLRDFPEWDDRKIAAAMNLDTEKPVKLKEPIPVHIAYFTAWVDDDGNVAYLNDVYRYDAAQGRN